MLSLKSYFLVIMFLFSINLFAQVESTTTGGRWIDASTWVNGVVPSASDNVIIKGPVTLDLITYANSIQIKNTGGLAPEVISTTTYKLYVANYIWNDGTINGRNLEIFVGGNQAGSIYNTANGTWTTGTLNVVDTLTHALLSEGKWFQPAAIRADSATFMSAGNIEIDSTTLYARKIILGQNLQNEKMVMDHGSVLRVENFVNLVSDTAGLEFRNNSYISSSPYSGTSTNYTDVILKGDVGIGADVNFYGNTILNGNMYPQFTVNYKITSSGLFQNNGEVKSYGSGSTWKLSFDIWGDLINNGNWTSNTVRMMGTGNHLVSTDPNFTFNPSSFLALNSTITVGTSPLSPSGLRGSSFLRFDNTQVQIMKLILQNGSSLNLLSNSSLAVNELFGNGNEIKFINDSYLSSYSGFPLSLFKDVTLTGNIGIGANINFDGSCYQNGNMYPQFANTYKITSTGLFQNNGEIKSYGSGSSWKLQFDFIGDLINNGNWDSDIIEMLGTSDHNLTIDTSYSFAPSSFICDSSSVLSNSDLRFDNSYTRIKYLILQNSNSVTFNNSTFAGTINGNGNSIFMNNNSYFTSHNIVGATTLNNISLKGSIGIGTNLYLNGYCYLSGNMYPQFANNYKITSNGLFQNNGNIKSYGSGSSWKLTFDIEGDFENTGYLDTELINITGNSNQHIGLADTSSISKVLFYANRGGNNFQWMLNGNQLTNGGDISGATSNALSINNFNSNYYGIINCVIDSAGNSITSRDITVNDIITDIDNGRERNENHIPKFFVLSQNYPNPFNPSTTIKYSIPAITVGDENFRPVQLKIYDILGREIATLVNKRQSPGRYSVTFNAENLPSGFYFYRLKAGEFIQTRKMLLLK